MMGIEPVTRKEMFMAAAAGENVTAPTPVTREEYFLSKIAGSGSGGGGAFVVDIVTDGDGAYTLNNTYEEIENAIESGVSVLCCITVTYPNGMQVRNYAQLSQYVHGSGVIFVSTQVIDVTKEVIVDALSISTNGEVISTSISVSGAT